MSNYPNSMPVFPAPSAGSYLNSPNHLTAHTQITGELSSIMGEVGLNPRGVDITVKARLDRIEADIAAVGSTASAAVKNDGTVNATNLLSNGDFEDAPVSSLITPAGWTVSGAGATFVSASAQVKVGKYSAVLSRSGTDCYAQQNVHAAKGIAYWKGRTVTLGVWVFATVASRARLYLSDGVATVFSSYHTGGSTWEFLTVSQTINSSATVIQVGLGVETGNTSAYFDGAICVEGSSAFAFSPKPAEEGVWADYSAASTIVGWSGFTIKKIMTKKIGNRCFFSISISGTSNSATTTITMPYNIEGNVGISMVYLAIDNGGARTSALASGITTNVIAFYKDLATNAFTASGTKTIIFQGSYEVA